MFFVFLLSNLCQWRLGNTTPALGSIWNTEGLQDPILRPFFSIRPGALECWARTKFQKKNRSPQSPEFFFEFLGHPNSFLQCLWSEFFLHFFVKLPKKNAIKLHSSFRWFNTSIKENSVCFNLAVQVFSNPAFCYSWGSLTQGGCTEVAANGWPSLQS